MVRSTVPEAPLAQATWLLTTARPRNSTTTGLNRVVQGEGGAASVAEGPLRIGTTTASTMAMKVPPARTNRVISTLLENSMRPPWRALSALRGETERDERFGGDAITLGPEPGPESALG